MLISTACSQYEQPNLYCYLPVNKLAPAGPARCHNAGGAEPGGGRGGRGGTAGTMAVRPLVTSASGHRLGGCWPNRSTGKLSYS